MLPNRFSKGWKFAAAEETIHLFKTNSRVALHEQDQDGYAWLKRRKPKQSSFVPLQANDLEDQVEVAKRQVEDGTTGGSLPMLSRVLRPGSSLALGRSMDQPKPVMLFGDQKEDSTLLPLPRLIAEKLMPHGSHPLVVPIVPAGEGPPVEFVARTLLRPELSIAPENRPKQASRKSQRAKQTNSIDIPSTPTPAKRHTTMTLGRAIDTLEIPSKTFYRVLRPGATLAKSQSSNRDSLSRITWIWDPMEGASAIPAIAPFKETSPPRGARVEPMQTSVPMSAASAAVTLKPSEWAQRESSNNGQPTIQQ